MLRKAWSQSMKTGTELFVQVHILDVPYHLDRPFTYYVPEALQYQIAVGCFVVVPFGGGNQRKLGLVVSLSEDSELSEIKPILSVVGAAYTLSDEMMGICRFLKEHTFCTIGDAAKTVIPVGALNLLYDFYEAPLEKRNKFLETYGNNSEIGTLFALICRKGGASDTTLRKHIGPHYRTLLAELVRHGYVTRSTRFRERENVRVTEMYTLNISPEEAYAIVSGDAETKKRYNLRVRSEIYDKILLYLMDGAEHEKSMLMHQTGASVSHLTTLQRAKIIAVHLLKKRRGFNTTVKSEADNSPLSPQQEEARKRLSALCAASEPKAALLYGVTGSGKTRVIKALMDEVIARGQQVIMLVPEIALTPQSVGIFCAYYGSRVAVVHSALSIGERLEVWRNVRAGEIDLVIGTRSAIFAPFSRLGMIVIDEEQEHTYKSECAPRYHARDVARYRCAKNNAFLLLASATPSFESYSKAKKGVYALVELTERYGAAKLPEVILADLKQDTAARELSSIGSVLRDELSKTLDAGEQSILFINRRGYHHYITCMSCGTVVMCPRCSVSLTYHAARGINCGPEMIGVLVCHYCGHREPVPIRCPECHSEHIKRYGFGTQRVEEELKELYPQARVLRMDADTTQSKAAHEDILDKFRKHEADILLGTQMVTKGHDFPDVTLVGILNADAMLYQDDYRAGEKTFSMLTQVVGRAGRADKAGLAVIQTYNPDHETLRLAAKQDYRAFYEKAILLRQALVFPPFCDMISLTLVSEEEKEAVKAAAELRRTIEERLAPGAAYAELALILFGPFEAQIYRVNEKYRMRMIIKCKMNRRTREFFSDLLQEFSRQCGKKVTITIDINPENL